MNAVKKGNKASKIGILYQFNNDIKNIVDSRRSRQDFSRNLNAQLIQTIQQLIFLQLLQHSSIIPRDFIQESIKSKTIFSKTLLDLHFPFDFPPTYPVHFQNNEIWINDFLEEIRLTIEKYEWTIDETVNQENVITPEILAYIHEKSLDDQQQSGSFYTPKTIAEYMARQTIEDYIINQINSQFSKNFWDLEKEILRPSKNQENQDLQDILEFIHTTILPSIKICDNSCGAGAFLIAILAVLSEIDAKCILYLNKKDIPKRSIKKINIISENIYGVDLNAEAINIAKMRLWFSAISARTDDEKGNIFSDLHYHIQIGNTLLGSNFDSKQIQNENSQYGQLIPFHWRLKFPEIAQQGGFDVIIGNPPYIRQEKVKHLTDEFGIAFKSLLEKLYTPFNSQFDLAIYFILRSIQLLRPGGYHSYIVTSKWLRAKYGDQIKNLLFKSTRFYKLVDFTGIDVFFGAKVDTIIYFLSKHAPNGNHSICYSKATEIKDISTIEAKQYHIPFHDLESNDWLLMPPIYYEISKFLNQSCKRVKDLSIKIYRGITTGFNSAFVISQNQMETILNKEPDSAKFFHPVITGDELEPFGVKWKQQFLLVIPDASTSQDFSQLHPILFEYLEAFETIKTSKKGKGIKKRDDQGQFWWELRTCEYYSEFLQPKLVWQRVTQAPRFYLDRYGKYLLDSTSCLRAELKLLKILQIIFSSSFIHRFYVKHFVHLYGNTGYLLSNQYIERIPICPIQNEVPFIILSDYLNFAHYHGNSANEEIKEPLISKEIYDFFVNITNMLVYETYFYNRLYSIHENASSLSELLATYLEPIPFDFWINLTQYREKTNNYDFNIGKFDGTNEDWIGLTNKIQKIIIKTYQFLHSDVKLNDFIKNIKNEPWINQIEHKTE